MVDSAKFSTRGLLFIGFKLMLDFVRVEDFSICRCIMSVSGIAVLTRRFSSYLDNNLYILST